MYTGSHTHTTSTLSVHWVSLTHGLHSGPDVRKTPSTLRTRTSILVHKHVFFPSGPEREQGDRGSGVGERVRLEGPSFPPILKENRTDPESGGTG